MAFGHTSKHGLTEAKRNWPPSSALNVFSTMRVDLMIVQSDQALKASAPPSSQRYLTIFKLFCEVDAPGRRIRTYGFSLRFAFSKL